MAACAPNLVFVCPCGATAGPGATTCPACGAAWLGWQRPARPGCPWRPVAAGGTEKEAFRRLLDTPAESHHDELLVLAFGEDPARPPGRQRQAATRG